MSGNVLEWTRSLYKGYPYASGDGRENLEASSEITRIMRGGSFSDPSGLARCAFRFRNEPDSCHGDLGFRVVVLPFSSGL
jgi:formylglycine-generating enzyme required for sulfatase activity